MKPDLLQLALLRHLMTILFAIGWSSQSPAKPIPVPEWAKPVEASLPQISPELVSEVDDIFWFNEFTGDEGRNPRKLEKLQANDLRIVELRERAGQAMIWQYLKWTDAVAFGLHDSGEGCDAVLSSREPERKLRLRQQSNDNSCQD